MQFFVSESQRRVSAIFPLLSMSDAVNNLRTRGVAVVPVFDPATLPQLRARVAAIPRSAPYFRPDALYHVLGGFQALGDPWSIWHEDARAIRTQISSTIRTSLLAPYFADQPGTKVALLIDRLMTRPAGVNINGEAWHKDVMQCPRSTTSYMPRHGHLEVFGGWTNFDDTDQYFRCLPGSHVVDGIMLDARTLESTGFASIDPALHEEIEKHAETVVIPPGHHVIFPQYISHTIVKQRTTRPNCRMFVGFMASDDLDWTEYVFGGNTELRRLAEEQALPLLPSGQTMPMYAANHASFMRHKPFKALPDVSGNNGRCLPSLTLVQHMAAMYTKEYLAAFASEDGIAPRVMPSLREISTRIHTPMCTPVTDEELAHHIPTLLT